MDTRTTYAIYDDEEILLDAVKNFRHKGVRIKEVYTPFPVHGLEKALGLPHTRLSIASFIYGIVGLFLGLFMMWYMMVSDWPVNIGGKPNFTFFDNLPSFIPVAFEITVLCAAHGMVITFLIRSKLLPGAKNTNPFPETTADKFAIEFDKENVFGKKELLELINETKVFQIKEKELE
jgi:hypothetical protein